jgi:AraC-like DNA-binding protein
MRASDRDELEDRDRATTSARAEPAAPAVASADRYAIHALTRAIAYATVGDDLGVSLLWGVPDEADLAAMIAGWQAHAPLRRHACLFDAGGVTHVEPRAFHAVLEYQARDHVRLARDVIQMAMIAPRTQSGAVIAGFPVLYPPPYPTRVFTTRAEALAWLDLASLAPTVAALAAEVSGDDAVGALRRWLRDAELDLATLATAARALALSPRSLQRRLGEAATSFDRERVRAQVSRAQRLMATTELTLTAIAIAVGCGSSSSFSDLFRREVGCAPSAWRHQRSP